MGFEPEGGGGSSPSTTLTLIKQTVTFEDFQPNGTSSGTFQIGTLPAGAVPVHYKFKLVEAFAAPFSGFYGTMNIRTTEDFAVQQTIIGVPSNTVGAFGALASQTVIPNQVSTDPLYAYITIGDDGETVVIDDLTAGSMTIWVWYLIGT